MEIRGLTQKEKLRDVLTDETQACEGSARRLRA
jgi:hypothetical protein